LQIQTENELFVSDERRMQDVAFRRRVYTLSARRHHVTSDHDNWGVRTNQQQTRQNLSMVMLAQPGCSGNLHSLRRISSRHFHIPVNHGIVSATPNYTEFRNVYRVTQH